MGKGEERRELIFTSFSPLNFCKWMGVVVWTAGTFAICQTKLIYLRMEKLNRKCLCLWIEQNNCSKGKQKVINLLDLSLIDRKTPVWFSFCLLYSSAYSICIFNELMKYLPPTQEKALYWLDNSSKFEICWCSRPDGYFLKIALFLCSIT